MTTPKAALLQLALICLPALAEPTPEQRAAVPLLDTTPREIVPGVYSLGELAPVHVYLIVSEDGLVLIDTGYLGAVDDLARAISSLGQDPGEIAHILVTHLHLDHWMSMDYIRSVTGARTYMGAADAALVEAGAAPEIIVPARTFPRDLAVPPTRVDVHLEGDQRLPIPGLELWALACPGHTRGSVCYYLETGPWRVLFGGDTVMSVRAGLGTYMAGLHERLGGEIDAYRRTLSRLSELPVNLSLPSHPYFDRRKTGNHPHPVVSAEGWRSVLREGLRELDEIEARHGRDGRDFLDQRPRFLAPGVAYLGGSDGQAAYALRSDSRVCLVDPFRLDPRVLRDRLARLGLGALEIASLLLTEPGSSRTDLLTVVAPHRPVEVWGSPAALAGLDAPGVLPRSIRGERRLTVCDRSVEAIALSSWKPDAIAYLTVAEGRLAAFTGEAISPLTADETIAIEAGSPGWMDNLSVLEPLPVELWLPGRPFAEQNANLYGDSWFRTVRVNRLALASKRRSR